MVALDVLESTEAPDSGVSWVELSEALGCEEMRARVWRRTG
jgi:hypothetical protein